MTTIKAQYHAGGNAIIPNTFQHPNVFVDKLMYYLTPEEYVVLVFAMRQILGYKNKILERKDHISLSQIMDGYTNRDGEIMTLGCGLSVNAVRKALDALAQYQILIPTSAQPGPRGQEYWLQDNVDAIAWDGLVERKQRESEKNKGRTQKASASRKSALSSDDTPTLSSDDTPTLSSDDTLPYRRTIPYPIVGRYPALSSDDNTKPIKPIKPIETQAGASASANDIQSSGSSLRRGGNISPGVAAAQWGETINQRAAESLLLKAAGFPALPTAFVSHVDVVHSLIVTYGEDVVLEALRNARSRWCATPRKSGGGTYSVLNPAWIDWAIADLSGQNGQSKQDKVLDYLNGEKR